MLPVLIGITAFLIVVGPRVLDPTNIGWLGRGDPATHYIGWLFYKNSDWTFPIGLNPDYGLELGNAIIFSDSIPLFAFVFKLLSPNLPEPFQYFGFWLLVCFVLQAWFGYKLIGLWSNSVMIRALSAALVVFAPPMIWRLHGHLSLVGHFLIIAALYLVFHPEPKRRILSWILLLVFASLTHPYLFAMTGLLWLADLQRRSEQPIFKSSFAIKETAATVAVLAVTCWQAGYFSVGKGTSGGGFGIYRMNLLSVVDANGWSYILGDIPVA
jgi:hypothetical protein